MEIFPKIETSLLGMNLIFIFFFSDMDDTLEDMKPKVEPPEQHNVACEVANEVDIATEKTNVFTNYDNPTPETGKKTFKCHLCSKQFAIDSSPISLARHISAVHKNERPFECPQCPKTFNLKASMASHIRTVHDGKMPFKCDVCELSFTQRNHMRMHKKRYHDGSFECPKCKQIFNDKMDMKKHISMVHEENRCFKCDFCELSFTKKSHRDDHVSCVHKQERPFKCSVCSKLFGRNTHLKKHISSVHEGEKPFRCDMCNKRFAAKHSLQKHMNRAHQISLSKEEYQLNLEESIEDPLYLSETDDNKSDDITFSIDIKNEIISADVIDIKDEFSHDSIMEDGV